MMISFCVTMEGKQKLAGNLNSIDHLKLQVNPVLSGISCSDHFNPGIPPYFKMNTMKEEFVKRLYFILIC